MTNEQKPVVEGSLCIEVNVTCPHCGSYINLLDSSDTNDYDHNDCGDILKQTCPSNEHWSESCEKTEVDDVTCSECKGVFDVRGVGW